jgi:ATP-dependent DNA helicase DinG
VRAKERFSEQVIQRLKAEIDDARGNEIFALGYTDERGIVTGVDITARGNEDSVLALRIEGGPARPADVFIHNHPSGFLAPSDQDLRIASRAAEAGVGAFIIDNGVGEVYVIAEPARKRIAKKLDADTITAALEEGGAIALRLPSYEPRPSQLDLMRLIIRGFNEDALVAAEAGTGVGKSFAYLLPAMSYALVNNERIVISTATITLQQQLYDKDIPLVSSALKKRVKAILIKGRGNYLCRRRLEDALREPVLGDPEDENLYALAAWAETTKTGNRSDLSFMPAEGLWSRVCSEADMCMGMRCPERERCFVLALRKDAADAQILVVNHHLLFADLAARQEGAGYENTVVLPPYTRVVIDEAHTAEGAATSFFSRGFSRPGIYRQLGRLYRRRRARRTGLLLRLASIMPGDQNPDEGVDAVQRVRASADALDAAALEFCGDEGAFRLTAAREASIAAVLIPCLADLRENIAALAGIIRAMVEKADEDNPVVWEIKSVLRRFEAIGTLCGSFTEYAERTAEVMWIERHTGQASREESAEFTVTPVDVAPSLRDALFEPNKTVICVSATLTAAESFAYWSGRSGLALVSGRDVFFGRFPSPFPYDRSVLLTIPADAPLPEEDDYGAFVDNAAAKLVEIAGGSALVLFTSYQSLKSAYNAAASSLEKQGIRCLKQGDDDRSRLLETFLADKSSALFATDSFWEGVDAPGDTLRLVVLCRLPFRAPRDPVFEARREALEKRGGNPFMELSLPESVMKFRQGFGRLIRRSDDRGVVVVLDSRTLRKRYGQYFLRSLPKTRTVFSDFSAVLRETERFLFP